MTVTVIVGRLAGFAAVLSARCLAFTAFAFTWHIVVSSRVLYTQKASCYRDPHPLLNPQQMTADPLPLFTPLSDDTLVAVGST